MRSLTVTHHKPEASGDLSRSMSFCVQLPKNGRTSDGHLSVVGVHPKNPTTRVHAPTVQALMIVTRLMKGARMQSCTPRAPAHVHRRM